MLDLIILTSLVSLGFFVSGIDGYLLGNLKKLFAASLGGVLVLKKEWYFEFSGRWTEQIFKPIWGCPTCMSSFWGVVVYLLFEQVSRETIYELPILIICSAGLNFIIFNNYVKKMLDD